MADTGLDCLKKISDYLRRNFPDFFTEARFWVGDDDYFLYARFGAYLARSIETRRANRGQINRGFTVLNKMARASQKHPRIRQMLLSGPLEYIVDAPKARALARKRLSPAAQGYLSKPCANSSKLTDRRPAAPHSGTLPGRTGPFFSVYDLPSHNAL